VTGFQITTLCSTVILVTPLLAAAGLMLLVRPLALGRVLVGLAIGTGIVTLCNLLRYGFAAIAMQTWGSDGFELVHRYLGSLLVIAGFIAAVILLLRFATMRSTPQRGRHS
jgi:exosortase/archaeosortase family protein